jgi:site-specific recombinase XerD
MPKDELFKLDNFIKSYLNEKKALNSAKNTIMSYQSVLNTFYEYYTLHYDEISLECIDRVFIVNYLESLGLSINSKNLHLVVLKNFFKYLQSHFYPLSDFKSRLEELNAKAQKREPVALSKSEYEKVMLSFLKEGGKKKRSFFSYRNTLLLKILLLSGVRV